MSRHRIVVGTGTKEREGEKKDWGPGSGGDDQCIRRSGLDMSEDGTQITRDDKHVEQSTEGKGEVCEREHAAGVDVVSAIERKERLAVKRRSRIPSGRA